MPATEAMVAMVKVLHDAGCLREPEPPPGPAMTLGDAAQLVIRRARTRRLEADDDDDIASVVNARAMFVFAWEAAKRHGLDAADHELNTAYRMLAEHHGLL